MHPKLKSKKQQDAQKSCNANMCIPLAGKDEFLLTWNWERRKEAASSHTITIHLNENELLRSFIVLLRTRYKRATSARPNPLITLMRRKKVSLESHQKRIRKNYSFVRPETSAFPLPSIVEGIIEPENDRVKLTNFPLALLRGKEHFHYPSRSPRRD